MATLRKTPSGDKSMSKNGKTGEAQMPGCVIKSLPKRLLIRAAETARTINPANAPVFGPLSAVSRTFHIDEPLRIAVLTAKYWGPKPHKWTVSFMESTPTDLKDRIISHMNAWTKCGNVS